MNQAKSKIRQLESKLKSDQRRLQSQLRQAETKLKAELRRAESRRRQVVNKHNSEVRAHNARVRANRQRLKNAISRLSQKTVTTRLVHFHNTVSTVQSTYERLERAAEAGHFDENYNQTLDLAEREAANNVEMMNALLGDAASSSDTLPNASESPLIPILQNISPDLSKRWEGALFSLNPENPDAARHFCTSAREIIVSILNAQAPDQVVINALPDCARTEQGDPTRRSKIHYLLHRKGVGQVELEDFVEANTNNLIELFRVFNEGTHGSAGAYNLAQLQSVRKRVEDGIMFLHNLIN